ncbi:YnbE family lipoprotein [Tsuneonella sp. SYSU-LHT278]|uniref:YnbE family lipoprotein n=1 Tax=Tsuneonella sediminis TaxID=3416089 RepID=UPI003F78C671
MAGAWRKLLTGGTVPGGVIGLLALGGCVQVTAPDKPIVIELNVNIRQEVIYRLAADAENTIDQNEDIF